MYVCIPGARLVPTDAEDGIGSTGTGIPDPCEPPHGCWESSLSPLEEEPELIFALPSHQPHFWCLNGL